MAENLQETRPPEPPPKPPEVPKPTEQSNRSEAKEHNQPNESQQSAQQDARNAAQSEHAKATNGPEPDGLRPTPEVQARLDEHSAAKNGPEGLRPTPEFQERLDAHTAAKAERNASARQDSISALRPQDSQAAQRPQEATAGDRNAAAPAGEQAGEHAAARQAAATEQAKAAGDTATPGEAPRPQSAQGASQPALDNGQPQEPARATHPPEESRNDESVTASPPDESAAALRPADQNTAAVDQNTPRQATVDQDDTAQRQPAADQNASQQTAGGQGSAAEEQSRQPAETAGETGDNLPGPPENSYDGPDRRQYAAQHLDPASDLRTSTSIADTEGVDNPPKADPAAAETATDAGDLTTEVGDGSGPWFDEGTNHREGGAVQQMTGGSCVSASGEMLTDGRVTQPELLSELGGWSNLSALREELNNRDGGGTWTGHYFEDGSAALRRASEGPMAAQVQAPSGRAHMVMLEPGENGSFTVRDPYEGSSYDVDSSWVEKYVAGGVFR